MKQAFISCTASAAAKLLTRKPAYAAALTMGVAFFAQLIAVSPAYGQSLNFVVNGSFEQPDIAFDSFVQVPSILGWSVVFGALIEVLDHPGGGVLLPFVGDQFCELDSVSSTGIVQNVPTQLGSQYVLSFAFSARPGVADNHLIVRWGGSVVADLTADGTGLTNTDWKVYSFTVTATSSTTALQFEDASVSDSLGTWIDGIRLEQAGATAVGGETLLIDRFQILWPWLVLSAIMLVTMSLSFVANRKTTRNT
jgi:hypothetical protein